MSVSVLFALVDVDLFKSLNQEEMDQVTKALIAEIESDPLLKQRLTNSVSQSAAEIAARRDTSMSTRRA
jgi:hypothetical protein